MPPPQVFKSNLNTASAFKKRRVYSEAECWNLCAECDDLLKSVDEQNAELLCFARELSTRAGLSMDTDLPALLRNYAVTSSGTTTTAAAAASGVVPLTGGHSNTDHRVPWTGHYATDRTAQFRRDLLSRNRSQCPENRGDDRWDKPRIPGERRRRIVREKDLPGAPPIPPATGYIVFIGQMTIKWRHDRPNERHDQTRVVQEVSKLWRIAVTKDDHDYYNRFAEEAKAEYAKQQMEFRATGVYTPSETFERPMDAAFWVRKKMSEKNDLEKEIAGYETVLFPMRPPEYEEDHKKRDRISKEKRKLKLKQEAEERRRLLEEQAKLLGVKPPQRRKRRKKRHTEGDCKKEEAVSKEPDATAMVSGTKSLPESKEQTNKEAGEDQEEAITKKDAGAGTEEYDGAQANSKAAEMPDEAQDELSI